MRKRFLMLLALTVVLHNCQAQTNNNPTPVTVISPVVVSEVGDVQTGVDWFIDGLEWGSGIAALLFGFMTVRRALSLGDAWND